MEQRPVTLAIVGVTGSVGRALLQALEESDLAVNQLRLLSSERGAGAEFDFRGEIRRADALGDGAFRDVDLAFFAATEEVSRAWTGRARAEGCLVVDLSPAFRLDDDVPLVVPELNADDAGRSKRGIVSVPGAASVQLALVLGPLQAAAGLERVVVTSCESVSGAGQVGIEELEGQTRAMLGFQEPPPATVFPHRIAFNLVPQVGAIGGRGKDGEHGIVLETRRLLGAGAPALAITSLRVPLFYGHTQAVNVRTARVLPAEAARSILRQAPGVKVIDAPGEGVYPMPMLAVNDDAVLVGRIRDDPSQERGLDLLTASDNLRRGAATSALGVARVLLESVGAAR